MADYRPFRIFALRQNETSSMPPPFFPHFPTSLPEPPYWAALFLSERSDALEGYEEMDRATIELAATIPGYLGYASLNQGHLGLFISYWLHPEAIEAWRLHAVHQRAKQLGKTQWYRRYVTQLARVESHVQGGAQALSTTTP